MTDPSELTGISWLDLPVGRFKLSLRDPAPAWRRLQRRLEKEKAALPQHDHLGRSQLERRLALVRKQAQPPVARPRGRQEMMQTYRGTTQSLLVVYASARSNVDPARMIQIGRESVASVALSFMRSMVPTGLTNASVTREAGSGSSRYFLQLYRDPNPYPRQQSIDAMGFDYRVSTRTVLGLSAVQQSVQALVDTTGVYRLMYVWQMPFQLGRARGTGTGAQGR